MFSLRRRLAILVVMVLCALPLLAGCGDSTPTATSGAATTAASTGNGAATTAAGTAATTSATTAAASTGGQKATISFWNGFTGPDRAAVEEITKRFGQANPNVTVNMDISPWDSLMQKLLSTMSTGQGPDVVAIHFQYLPQYAKSGYIMDLSPAVQAGTDLDPANWPPALVDLLKYNGKFYAAPMNFATLMLYYNKDMFKAAGLDPEKPPTNWNDWIDAIKKLSKQNGGASQYGLSIGEHDTIPNWPLFLWGNGGDVIKDGKSDLTDPKTVQALKTWSDLVKTNKISPVGLSGAEADKLFQTQKAAMEVTGPWMTNGFTEAGINYGVAPVPAGSAGPLTLGDTVILMVNKSSKNADAAINFVKYWNSKEAQLYLATQTGFPPARLDLANSPELAKNPWSPRFASVAAQARFYLGGQEKFAQIDSDVFTPMIQSITLGQKSVEDATKEADQKLSALLK
ncbi:MAG TPA: ABC transporter substrate-binding protein [Chloroflexia bacterium]|nr:ABC transporter substrate-binding protein [Chloroflexia bacterium]